MIGTVKKFNIYDTFGNCYKLDNRNNLVVARDNYDATAFTYWEANARVGTGRKAHFYKILEADVPDSSININSDSLENSNTSKLETFKNPTKFDGLQNNWESLLSDLCYMSDHMSDYQNNLNQMLSDVDREICDLMHYLEFKDLSDSNLLKVGRMLQDCRRRRREIKNEMDRTESMRAAFLDDNFGNKVRQSLTTLKKMNERQYSPRKLNDLFE